MFCGFCCGFFFHLNRNVGVRVEIVVSDGILKSMNSALKSRGGPGRDDSDSVRASIDDQGLRTEPINAHT